MHRRLAISVLLVSFVAMTATAQQPPTVDELIAKLKDPNDYKRQKAAEALDALGTKARAAVPALLEVMKKDEEPANVRAAALALGSVDRGSAPVILALTDLLNKKDQLSWVRGSAAIGLGRLGSSAKESLSALGDFLADPPDPGSELAAHYALIRVTGKRGGHLDPLIEALALRGDDAADQVNTACFLLGELGPKVAGSALDGLANVFARNNRAMKCSAMYALAKLGPADPPKVLPLLIGVLEGDDRWLRNQCIRALPSMGTAARKAARPLKKLLPDATPEAKILIQETIDTITGK